MIDQKRYASPHVGSADVASNRQRGGLLADRQYDTVLIEDIDRLRPRVQAKIAHYCFTGRLTPQGARRRIKGHVRIMMTATRSLKQLCAHGALDDELAHALAGLDIIVPALRERIEDFDLVLDAALAKLSPGSNITLSSSAKRRLIDFDWSGNDEQVVAVASRIVALPNINATDKALTADDVAALLGSGPPRAGERMALERDLILDALWRHEFHRDKTARYLGISRKTLYNKIRRYAIAG